MDRKLFSLSSSKIERILRLSGFRFVRQKGSHRQFVGFIGNSKKRVTLIANKRRYAPKTLASIIRQSGMSEKEWSDMI